MKHAPDIFMSSALDGYTEGVALAVGSPMAGVSSDRLTGPERWSGPKSDAVLLVT